ncbi:MAG: hypothetical protein WAP35_09590 [Solirubrobacterales bacterium]
MKTAVDTGVLIAAYAGEGPGQRDCAEAIERALDDDKLVIVANAISAFVETVTDTTRFENAPTLPQVTDLCNEFASAANVEIADLSNDDLVAALSLLREHELPADRLDPALQAVRLRRLGVSRLLTTDADAFAEFGFIETEDPRRAA